MITLRFPGLKATFLACLLLATPSYAAPIPTAASTEEIKKDLLKLNSLTTTEEMDEKLKKILWYKDSAKKMVEVAVDLIKDDSKVFKFNAALVIGKVAQNLKDYATAEKFYTICEKYATQLESDSMVAQTYQALIDLYWDQKKFEAVEDVCSKILETQGGGKEVNSAKGYAIERMVQSKARRGDTKEALNMAERIIQIQPDGWYAYTLKGYVQRESGKLEEAIETYEDVVTRIKDDKELDDDKKKTYAASIRYLLTSIYVDNKQVDEAAKILQALIKEFPDRATYYNDLGSVWSDHDIKLEESEKLIRKALELDNAERQKLLKDGEISPEQAKQENSAYLDSLGWVLYKLGKYEDAKKYLLQASKNDDDSAHLEIWDHLADCYIKLGKTQEAVDTWIKALKFEDVSPRDPERRKKITEKLNNARRELKKQSDGK